MPGTTARKFGYADNLALTTSDENIGGTEENRKNKLDVIGHYCRRWGLQRNAVKTSLFLPP